MSDTTADLDATYALAVQALRSGQTSQAERQLRHLLADTPDDVNGLRLLGLALLGLKKPAAAIKPLQRAVELAPEFVHARTDLARALRRNGRPSEALTELKRVLRDARTLHVTWLALGDVLVDLRRYPDAAAAFTRARRTDPHRERLVIARAALARAETKAAELQFREILHADPGNIGALCGLAGVCVRGGFVVEAERLLRHGLQQSEHEPLLWRGLNEVLLDAGRLEEAEAAIRRTLLVVPEDPESQIALGNTCARLLKAEAALAAYREAKRLNPSRRLVQLSIGHLLKTLGRRQECEAAYHECLVEDPTSGEAYWSLADLKNYDFTSSEVASMEAAAATSQDDRNVAMLHFALGHANERRGQDRSAFEHYRKGNALRARESPFDIDGFEAKTRRIRQSLNAAFFERTAGNPDPAPIFIVGLPRSGSTLVEQILASHSQVEATMELTNIPHFVRELDCLGADLDAYPECLRAAPPELVAVLGDRYIRDTSALRNGRPRFIDKLPNNFAHIGLIHAILPNATIIDVRRHPLDACFSCYKQNFAAGQTFTYDLDDLGRYYNAYLDVMAHWDFVLPGKVLHISYETLVSDPETTIATLLAHCGLAFEPQCLTFHETRRPIRTASSEQVRQPLYSTGIGHWRRFKSELRPLRESLGDSLDRYSPSAAAVETK